MQDRNTWRQFAEAWRESPAAAAAARSKDPAVRRLLAEVEEGLAETRQLIGRLRSRQAALLRTLRGMSRKMDINASRPLPRCSSSRPFPAGGGLYGVRHFHADAGPCVDCGEETGTGPIGWRKGDEPGPLCYDCLIEADRRIAAVPLLVDFMRDAGNLELASREEKASLASLLMTIVTVAESRNLEGLPNRTDYAKTVLVSALARLREERDARGRDEEEEVVSH